MSFQVALSGLSRAYPQKYCEQNCSQLNIAKSGFLLSIVLQAKAGLPTHLVVAGSIRSLALQSF